MKSALSPLQVTVFFPGCVLQLLRPVYQENNATVGKLLICWKHCSEHPAELDPVSPVLALALSPALESLTF